MTHLATDIMNFLIGQPDEALYTAATFTVVNFFIYFFYKHVPPKTKRELIKQFIEKLLAYIAFLIIATRLDSLFVANLVDWEKPTNFLVSMYILGREGKMVLNYIRSKGIEIPGILDKRMDNIREMGNGGTSEGLTPGEQLGVESLDEKIQNLRNQLEQAESLRQQRPPQPEDDTQEGGELQ